MAFVLWHDGTGDGYDRCSLLARVDGWTLSGTAALPHLAPRAHAGYRIEADASWSVRTLEVRASGGVGEGWLTLDGDGRGGWRDADGARPDLDGCRDVWLAFSPAGLTTAVRRLDLAVGAAATIAVIDVDVQRLTAQRETHTIARLDALTYRHLTGGRGVTVHVGPQGLVTEYEDGWKAVATG